MRCSFLIFNELVFFIFGFKKSKRYICTNLRLIFNSCKKTSTIIIMIFELLFQIVGIILAYFLYVMKKKKKKQPVNLDDVIKAMRRGNREGEQEVLGPGFHATNRVHRSKKTYTRKLKHKGTDEQ